MPSLTDRAQKVLAYLTRRRSAYARVFRTPHGQVVLEDLAGFCRANETTFHEDARAAALLEGRREVWLRIQQHLNLSPDELFRLTTGQPEAPRVEPRDSG